MPWVVVMTKPNCENIAVANLAQQGFTCYSPRFKEIRPDKVTLIKPLFPRYIFTLIDKFWYCIQGTRGVSYLLMGIDAPLQVPALVIDSIRSREDGEGFIMLHPKATITERFNKGDKVRAVEGPFADKLLIYEDMPNKDRVRVLASILGRQVLTTIPEKSLVAA